MKRALLFLTLVGWSVSLCAAQKKVGWSLGYYVSWDHSYSPSTIPWDAVTHMSNFQVTINNDGSLGYPDENIAKQLISIGHGKGKKVIFSIGGGGYGQQFANATTNANRAKFISRLMDYLRKLGYDGIDTDWEGNEVVSQFVAFHKDLRDSINALNPSLCITIAAEDWNPIAAQVHMYVDQINDMWYGAKADKYPGYLQSFIKLGVPKAKLAPGIGISPDQGSGNLGVQASVDLCNMVVDQGFGGIMLWCIQTKGFVPADLAAIAPFVPTGSTAIRMRQSTLSSPMSLSARYDWVAGTSEIRYAMPPDSDRGRVTLGIFDMQGSLIKNLFNGPAPANTGVLTVPIPRTDAMGAYIVKMSTTHGVQAAKVNVTR
jgi:hypothetical protein